MKKFFNVAMIMALVLTMFAGVSFANGAQDAGTQVDADQEYVPGELVVSIEPHASAVKANNGKGSLRSQEAKLNNKGFNVVDSLHDEEGKEVSLSQAFEASVIDNMGLVYLVQYDQSEYKNAKKAEQALKKELKEQGYKVRYVSKNYVMQTVGEVETQEASIAMHPNQQWHYNMINAPDAWNVTPGSSSVRVAILDTGIDYTHPSLSNYVNTGLSRSFAGDNNPRDYNGHGTHVAGTVASYGNVSGVMQVAELVAVKVLSDSGSGSLYGITQGVLYAADIGADVINMSLGGGGYNQSMDEATQTAVANGTIVIAAAGNDGRSSISYPAAYSSVIAVGSVTSSGTRSSFSNYGSGLEVMAPGSSIYSTWPNNSYNTISGTSMASPHAAGVAGLIRAADPSISVSDARSILRNTAQNAGSSYEYGYGIVDALAAVVAAGGGGGTPPTGDITQTSVSTNYSWYYRGETVHITATVTDENNNALSGANVNFTITRPNGTTVSNSATTNSSGVATWSIGSSSSTATGQYQVLAETTLSGYDSSSATTSFYMY